jgi:hypothetical protein
MRLFEISNVGPSRSKPGIMPKKTGQRTALVDHHARTDALVWWFYIEGKVRGEVRRVEQIMQKWVSKVVWNKMGRGEWLED